MLTKSDYQFYKADARAEIRPSQSALFGLVFKIDKKISLILDCNFYAKTLEKIKPLAENFCLNLVGQNFNNPKLFSQQNIAEIFILAYQNAQKNYTIALLPREQKTKVNELINKGKSAISRQSQDAQFGCLLNNHTIF